MPRRDEPDDWYAGYPILTRRDDERYIEEMHVPAQQPEDPPLAGAQPGD